MLIFGSIPQNQVFDKNYNHALVLSIGNNQRVKSTLTTALIGTARTMHNVVLILLPLGRETIYYIS